MRVLVTGATGALGSALVRALTVAGFGVKALVRRPQASASPGHEWCVGDLADRASLDRAVAGVDAAVHLAALLHVTNPAPELRAEYHRVNVEGTQSLTDAAVRAGVRRFLLASTTSVYGPRPEAADESTPPAPDSWYAESKLAAEAVALANHQPGAFDVSVLRLSAVYGPRIKGNYQRLLHALAAGRYLPLGSGLNRRSLVYEEDAAAAFVTALSHPAAAGRIFNVTDGTPHRLRDIVGAMCRALGRAEPKIAMPVRPAIVGVRVLERLARAVGRTPPITAATLAKYLEDSAVDAGRIARELAFMPRVDLEAGWRNTVQALRDVGQLPGGAR